MVALVSVAKETLNDRVMGLLERIDYRLAETAAEKDAIFQLRYKAYLHEGAIPENPTRRFRDALDETGNAWIFGVYIDGELASSIRLHIAGPDGATLPALNVFSDLLAPQLAAGKVMVDPTRFVADRLQSRRHPELCYVTTRLAWLASEFFNADYLLATVRVEHQAFYRRVFGHRPVCEARHYPSLTKPISLMSLDYPGYKPVVQRRYPFFRSTYFERRMLFARAVEMPIRTAA